MSDDKKEVSWPVEIELSKPIEAHGGTVKVLELQEPDLGVLEGIDLTVTADGEIKLPLGDLYKVAANLADIPPSAARKIKLADLPKFGEVFKAFFGEFLQVGG